MVSFALAGLFSQLQRLFTGFAPLLPHEIGTPLNIIYGRAELVQKKSEGIRRRRLKYWVWIEKPPIETLKKYNLPSKSYCPILPQTVSLFPISNLF